MALRLWTAAQWCGATGSVGATSVHEFELMQILGVRKGRKPIWTHAGADACHGSSVHGSVGTCEACCWCGCSCAQSGHTGWRGRAHTHSTQMASLLQSKQHFIAAVSETAAHSNIKAREYFQGLLCVDEQAVCCLQCLSISLK